jgi:hypothetical protein
MNFHLPNPSFSVMNPLSSNRFSRKWIIAILIGLSVRLSLLLRLNPTLEKQLKSSADLPQGGRSSPDDSVLMGDLNSSICERVKLAPLQTIT